jgi:hypothetical protein
MEIEPGNDLVLRFRRSRLAAADAIESPQNGRYGDVSKAFSRLQAIVPPAFPFERFFILPSFTTNPTDTTPGSILDPFVRAQQADPATYDKRLNDERRNL